MKPTSFKDIRGITPWQILCADGVAIVQMVMEKANDAIPQHSHAYDHHTLIARGSVRVWADDKHIGDYGEREAVFVRAGCKHLFAALQDNTVAYCIHNTHGGDAVEILAEHKLGA